MFVPTAIATLISISKAASQIGGSISFEETRVLATPNGGNETVIGIKHIGLYVPDVLGLRYEKGKKVSWADQQPRVHAASTELMHNRLGHPSHRVLQHMHKHSCVVGLLEKLTTSHETCKTCMKAKQSCPTFNYSNSCTSQTPALVHADTMVPFPMKSMGGNTFVLVMVDDYSGLVPTTCVESKSEIPMEVIHTLTQWRTQTCHVVKTVNIDQGTELKNKTVDNFC